MMVIIVKAINVKMEGRVLMEDSTIPVIVPRDSSAIIVRVI